MIPCPVSNRRVDSYTSRLNAGIAMGFFLVFAISQEPIFLVILLFDFLIIAYVRSNYSPLYIVSKGLLLVIKSKKKLINEAPIICSAKVSFLLSLLSLTCFLSGATATSTTLTVLLMIVAYSHSIPNYCLGYTIYHYLVLPYSRLLSTKRKPTTKINMPTRELVELLD